MFRSLFRRNRTIRVPIENSGHNVREVKFFQSPLSKPSNFITAFIIAYFVFRTLESYAVPKDKDKGRASWEEWKKKRGLSTEGLQDQQLSEHWKKAHEAFKKANLNADPEIKLGPRTNGLPPDVIATVALPVWIRPKNVALYQPDDPEFKDFARIQSDQKKIAELKKYVGGFVVSRLGDLRIKPKLDHIGFNGQVTIVLDLVPQLHAPPLYEVPALMLFKDGVSIGWKTLRPEVGSKMDSMMRPSATYQAAKASLRVLVSTTYAISKAKLFGGTPPHIHTTLCDHCKGQEELAKSKEASPQLQWPTDSQAVRELIKTMHDGQATKERHKELIKHLPFSIAIPLAVKRFRQTQAQLLLKSQQDKARGLILVKGVIICMGERGKFRMDVIASYLPSEDKFVGPPTLSNAYIVKDFSKVQKLEDEKKKKLIDARNQKQISQSEVKPPADEHEHSAEKPAPGKEKE